MNLKQEKGITPVEVLPAITIASFIGGLVWCFKSNNICKGKIRVS